MASERRLGAEGARNRELLVEATSRVLVQEGYAAVTARRVAEAAGLKVQLVYYYFLSMDDLILAVVARNRVFRMEQLQAAVESPDPLRALWALNSNPAGAIATSELLALANRREAIRNEVVDAARQFRRFQIKAVSEILEARGIDTGRYPPGALVTIVLGLGRALAQDSALGVTEGYAEAVALLESGLGLFDKKAVA